VKTLTTENRLQRQPPKDNRSRIFTVLRKVLDRGSVLAIDVPVTLPDGRQRIVHVRTEPEFNRHGAQLGYTGIVQDVTDRRMAEGKINRLVNFDEQAGLPNRRQLLWRTERALEFARRHNHQVSLLQIDLDRFKPINDASTTVPARNCSSGAGTASGRGGEGRVLSAVRRALPT
jgi:predicted signal transduction protein with EAL and GGDEF domain